MKTKFLLIPAFAGFLMMTSCNQKADEKTMSAITSLETDWKATSDLAMGYNKDVKEALEKCNTCCTKPDSVAGGGKTCCMMGAKADAAKGKDAKENEGMMAKCKEMMGNCMKDK